MSTSFPQDVLRRIRALEQKLFGVTADNPQTPVTVSALPGATDAQFPVYATAVAGNVSADGWYARSMSGDATIADTGAITLGTSGVTPGSYTVANVTVNAKGLVTAASSGTLPSGNVAIYSDGSDGSITFDGSSVVLGITPSSSIYTLARDICAQDMTINSGVTVNTGGFRVFVRGTLTIQSTGILGRPGVDASGTTNGTGRASAVVGGSVAGGAGQTNGASIGNTGSSTSPSLGGNGGAGGADGQGHGAGVGGTATAPNVNFGSPHAFPTALTGLLITAGTNPSFATGGAGGAGGACAATGVSGAGGGGGGVVIICADTISNSGTITAAGGNGSNAASGNAGGGGGGGGGYLVLYTNSSSVGGTVTAAGGTHGTGVGTGSNGSDGNSGTVITISP